MPSPEGGRRPLWYKSAASLPRWWPYALIVAVCFLVRLPTFGNPMLDFDEQLYLVVGDRILHGQLPYVDLWDRKPIGLFLFYSGVRFLGGDGIIQYQVVATLCVAITSSFIWTIVCRGTGMVQGFVAAIAYVLLLNVLGGTGGQAAVIYNAITICAVWAAFRSNDTQSPSRIIGLAMFAMALMGIAIQFKYTPMVEGAFMGCWFLLRMWQVQMPVLRIGLVAVGMVFLALLPTIAVFAYYEWIGHLDSFVQANFVSVFHRRPFPAVTRMWQVKFILIKALCVIAPTPLALALRWRMRLASNPADFWLLTGWTVFAVLGFGMLGDFYDFYFITVLPALCIMVAPLVGKERMGFAVGCMLCLWPLVFTPQHYFRTSVNRRAPVQLVDAITPYVAHRCLYVYDGPTILYLLTHACAPSRYIYPDHLTNPVETPALGVDPAQEEERVLTSRPGAIVTANQPLVLRVDPVTQNLVRTALARDYVLIARVPVIGRVLYVWALKDLHPGPASIMDPRGAIPE
ncbi:hypothetical protein [Novosphingobium nitrogenifigens]|nr:hypothetical protein [Novosphingobium nitrogenifigens]